MPSCVGTCTYVPLLLALPWNYPGASALKTGIALSSPWEKAEHADRASDLISY